MCVAGMGVPPHILTHWSWHIVLYCFPSVYSLNLVFLKAQWLFSFYRFFPAYTIEFPPGIRVTSRFYFYPRPLAWALNLHYHSKPSIKCFKGNNEVNIPNPNYNFFFDNFQPLDISLVNSAPLQWQRRISSFWNIHIQPSWIPIEYSVMPLASSLSKRTDFF